MDTIGLHFAVNALREDMWKVRRAFEGVILAMEKQTEALKALKGCSYEPPKPPALFARLLGSPAQAITTASLFAGAAGSLMLAWQGGDWFVVAEKLVALGKALQ